MNQPTDLLSLTGPTHLVGIGASAGGLEALEKFFRATPTDTGMAFVVIQHLSPDFRSLMDELLTRFTTMPVVTIEEQTPIAPNHVYLLPPKKDAVVKDNSLVAYDRAHSKQLSLPINLFFNSLAIGWGERAIGVILSGTGSDGSEGLIAIRTAGGYTLVQEPISARFDGMPVSAIATGCVDKVGNAEALPEIMLKIVKDPQFQGRAVQGIAESEEPLGIDDIYETLNDHFVLDFKQYKSNTIMRRIQRRVALGPKPLNLDEYAAKIKTVDDELHALYRDLLIGVTGFFRDVEPFNVLDGGILRKGIENLAPDQDYRVWVCGCSTGEEAYSLGMLLIEEFERLDRPINLKVFATDVNREYLNVASEGLFGVEAVQDIPENLRRKYFTEMGGGTYKVNSVLRKVIIFSEHNLLKNPPFTRINLLSCRNLLTYLKADVQAPAITSFNFALVPGGVLLLGASESLGASSDDFEPLDKQWRIFRKIRESSSSVPARTAEHVGQLVSIDYGMQRTESKNYLARLYHTVLCEYIPFGLILSMNGEVLDVVGKSNRNLLAQQNGGPLYFSSLVKPSVTKVIEASIKRLVSSKGAEGSCVELNVNDGSGNLLKVDVEVIHDKISALSYFAVVISPMPAGSASPTPNVDTTSFKNFSFPEDSQKYVNSLQVELLAVKEALQTNAEELETSNEELQASNEELQASNEELQSTNEELHSVNEELYTVNTELELKIVELDKTSGDLRNLVDSTQVASVFLDSNCAIRAYTPLIHEIFGVMAVDVGRDLRDFTPRVIDPNLWADIEAARSNQKQSETITYAKPPSSRIYWRRVAAYKNAKNEVDGVLITFVDMSRVRARGLRLVLQGIKSLFGFGRR